MTQIKSIVHLLSLAILHQGLQMLGAIALRPFYNGCDDMTLSPAL